MHRWFDDAFHSPSSRLVNPFGVIACVRVEVFGQRGLTGLGDQFLRLLQLKAESLKTGRFDLLDQAGLFT